MKKNERSVDNHLGCSGECGTNSVIVCCLVAQTILAYFSMTMTVVMTKLFFLHKHESRRLILFKLPSIFATILCSCMVNMIMPGQYCCLENVKKNKNKIKYLGVVMIDELKYHI